MDDTGRFYGSRQSRAQRQRGAIQSFAWLTEDDKRRRRRLVTGIILAGMALGGWIYSLILRLVGNG